MRSGLFMLIAAWGVLMSAAGTARAAVRITEWMYNPKGVTNFEYFELTNLGPGPVDMTGWSFDDNSPANGTPGAFSLSGFGVVAAGESVILTEGTAANFRAEWSLADTVKIVGGNTQNLSRSDGINVFDNLNALVDRLIYNDQGVGDIKGPRTEGVSGNPISLAVLGTNKASQWVLAALPDIYGSVESVSKDIGSPGRFSIVPEPASVSLAIGNIMLLAIRKRKA